MADPYKEKESGYGGADMSFLDARKLGKGLTGTFVAGLVLQIISYVAQTEREGIHLRQKEGIAAAKLQGVRFDRLRKPAPEQFRQLKEDCEYKKSSRRRQLGSFACTGRLFEVELWKINLKYPSK